MKNKPTILAIIPARGGSKAIPRKNLQPLAGHPLIYHSVKAALASQFINQTIVSSDDQQILARARSYGAQTLLRPKKLARDSSTSESLVRHVLDRLPADARPTYFILLQPTSPFRKTHHIDQAIRQLLAHPRANSMVSVTENSKTPFLIKQLNQAGYLREFFPPPKKLSYRRQDRPTTYSINGAIYLVETEYFMASNSFYSQQTLGYIMDRTSSLDIDDIFDLKLARLLAVKTKH